MAETAFYHSSDELVLYVGPHSYHDHDGIDEEMIVDDGDLIDDSLPEIVPPKKKKISELN
jgi:hypothetical protein